MLKPLDGVKVVEVAMWAFVPSAGAILADMGATVIKVEPPTGDPLRGLVIQGLKEARGLDLSWEGSNRGKRGITLDLREEATRSTRLRSLESSDVT